FFNPPPCVRGYTRAEQEVESDGPGEGYRVGSDTSKRGVPAERYCAEPEGSPIAVRGAQNAPYSGRPTAPSDGEVAQQPDCGGGYTRGAHEVGSHAPGEGYRVGSDTSTRGVPAESYCAEPEGSPIAVRGAQNAPYSGTPTAPSEDEVEQQSDRGEETLMYMRGIPGPATGPGLEITDLGGLLGV